MELILINILLSNIYFTLLVSRWAETVLAAQFSISNMQLSEINHFYLYVLKHLWPGGWNTIHHSEILYCCHSPGRYSTMVYMACLLNNYLLILETGGECIIQLRFLYACYSRTELQFWQGTRANTWCWNFCVLVSHLLCCHCLGQPSFQTELFSRQKRCWQGVSLLSRVVWICWS